MLIDSFSRRIDYLRLSVTDRCNLRCRYCITDVQTNQGSPADVMGDDEIRELVSCFAEPGLSGVGITGGEPLLRPGIDHVITDLAKVEGVRYLALSTNGLLLAPMTTRLKRADRPIPLRGSIGRCHSNHQGVLRPDGLLLLPLRHVVSRLEPSRAPRRHADLRGGMSRTPRSEARAREADRLVHWSHRPPYLKPLLRDVCRDGPRSGHQDHK